MPLESTVYTRFENFHLFSCVSLLTWVQKSQLSVCGEDGLTYGSLVTSNGDCFWLKRCTGINHSVKHQPGISQDIDWIGKPQQLEFLEVLCRRLMLMCFRFNSFPLGSSEQGVKSGYLVNQADV